MQDVREKHVDRKKIREGLKELLRYEIYQAKEDLRNTNGNIILPNFYKRVRDIAVSFLPPDALEIYDEKFRKLTSNKPGKDYLVAPHNSENSPNQKPKSL